MTMLMIIPFWSLRQHFRQHVKASPGLFLLTTSCKGSSVSCHSLNGERRDRRRGETTTAKMSSFSNKFGSYTMTQLNEILEDDEKLSKMVHEMDEVCSALRFCRPTLASYWLLFPVFFVPQPFVVFSQHTHGARTEMFASNNV